LTAHANRQRSTRAPAAAAETKSKVSRRRVAALQVNALPPDDATLREFMADLYAAMSMMRLLRQEIAATLSLSSAEYSVLLAVWYLEREGEMTVRAIANHLHVAAAYVTSEVGRLVDKGLLAKRPDPVDRRAVGVGLTKAARDLFERLGPMLRNVNSPLFTDISYGDLEIVHRFVRNIIERGYDSIRAAQAVTAASNGPAELRRPRRAAG
jgi:DNA-binding MarR family transcriptional regulator